jgi:hypothetical protein
MTTSPADAAKGHQRRRQAHDRGRITLVLEVILVLVAARAAAGRVPPLDKNCTALNKKYPHGCANQ